MTAPASIGGRGVLTASEQRIVDYLGSNAHRYSTAWDIVRAAKIKDDRCVRVMIHQLRHVRYVAIESRAGRAGGYRLVGPLAQKAAKQCGTRLRISEHSARDVRRLATQAFADEAASLSPELRRIAEKYGRKPSTVAKIALARVGA